MRIRTLKPDFWTHPVMARQSDRVKLLAIGLLNCADDEGYFYADSSLIRASLAPFSEDSRSVQGALIDLSSIGYVSIKMHPSHGPIGRVVNFGHHQRVNRPTKSKIKPLFEACKPTAAMDSEPITEPSKPNNGEITESSLNAHCGKGKEQGKEGKGYSCAPGGVASEQATQEENPSAYPKAFEEFWSAYPRKRSKGDALKAWSSLGKRRPSIEILLASIKARKESQDWTKDDGQFIPYPASWLRDLGWEDEVTATAAEASPNQRTTHDPVPCNDWRERLNNLDVGRKYDQYDRWSDVAKDAREILLNSIL